MKEDVRKLFEGMGACSSSCGEGGGDDIGRLFFWLHHFLLSCSGFRDFRFFVLPCFCSLVLGVCARLRR